MKLCGFDVGLDRPFFLIAGTCSIEGLQMSLDVAGTLKEACTALGIPLIYNGQEAGNEKRLEFFERDPIRWRPHPIAGLYTRLFALKERNGALHNAPWGARMLPVVNSQGSKVFSFVRQKGDDRVFAAFNMTPEPRRVTFTERLHHGRYRDFDTGRAVTVDAATAFDMKPWSYRLLTAE